MLNRLFAIFLVIFLSLGLSACDKVPAGHVAVKFDLYGGDKGVTGEVVGPGKYWLGWNEEMYLFPTFTQTDTWTAENKQSLSFQDRDGTVLTADVGVSYSVQADKVDTVFQKYRKGIEEISDIYMRNMIRDAINTETSQMDVEQIYGAGKEALMARVTERVRAQLSPIGIVVEKVYWIGAMRLPEMIVSAINSKIKATQVAQQRENELQTAKAQAEIAREEARGQADADVIAAKGRADANKMIENSVTPSLIEYTKAQRWDGKLPQVQGAATPFVNIK